ncbi:protein enabled isoform X1 [Halyomorpha halys]|uniref:protein enabled isoform X1 n=1 Tax=Halyomorpha halys TaxID=286706 RepID=UPI0006D50194|nr:protein enabled-like isoform X4 [Halyomorpha halys]
MSEQSIASARASVMVYDDTNKKWIPSGSSSGLSKVHIFQNITTNSFRVVARKLNDHEVVINCIIVKGLKYNQATNTFHQWRDQKQVYGLNFSSREDADGFARAMTHALDVLNSNSLPRPTPPTITPQPQSHYQQANGQYEEDMGYSQMIQRPTIYHQVTPAEPPRIDINMPITINTNQHSRTMTREDVAIIQERRMSQQSQRFRRPETENGIYCNGFSNNGNISTPPVPPAPAGGHHRTSSAPPAPQPPAMSVAPPPPPAPPAMAPPPPPPPPQPAMSRSSSTDIQDTSSLASQLQSARLRRSNKQSAENSGSSTSSSGSGNYGTLGRGAGGMASMMDEMAKTLARRRAAAERKETDPVPPQEPDYGTAERKQWGGNKASVGNGLEASPKPGRKQLASSEECLPKVNGETLGDLEALKQDLLREVRREINKAKLEIIEAFKTELNRR